jgi:hypothetical protein
LEDFFNSLLENFTHASFAAKMAIERMNTELARSRVQLGDPA